MEKYFGNAYRGDLGVPHADADRFVNIWIGLAAFSTLTFINPYMWQLSNQFNWHDHAMMFEHHHGKKAHEKNQPYEFQVTASARQVFSYIRISLSESGTKWTEKSATRTTSTGLSTSLYFGR